MHTNNKDLRVFLRSEFLEFLIFVAIVIVSNKNNNKLKEDNRKKEKKKEIDKE